MGKTVDEWLTEYSHSHRHPINRALHTVCVPAILFAIVALLWSSRIAGVRAAYVLMILVAPFYLHLGARAAAVMALQLGVCIVVLYVWPAGIALRPAAIGLFVLAWIGQFIGHAIEGRRPKFLQDLTFMLIGPLWVVLK
ncbi:MAG: Mpo1 family 2-hydroxy fatty acid dioxygenase [Steroidobacteraceae bacterium]